MIFLENRLTKGAFTDKHLDVLKVISSQVALSLENAVLYEQLEHKVKERTSELKKANDQLLEKTNEAKRANKAKSEFLANMSHEIRTPMNAILGFSEILISQTKNDNTPSKKKDRTLAYLQTIYGSSQALLRIINDILDLSKVEAGKMVLQYGVVSPRAVILNMKELFAQSLMDKNIDFSIEVDDVVPEWLMLDESRLRQVLLNLIGNAVKFTEEGFIRVILRREIIDEHDMKLLFEIHDSGIGIPQSQQDKVFDAFEQSSGQNHARYGGTGLGLTICRKLIKVMGGDIRLESETGKGTIFYFHLDKVTSGMPQAIGIKEEYGEVVFETRRILIADESRYNRDFCAAQLQDYNFEFSFAETPKLALQRADEIEMDLIILDVKFRDICQTSTELLLKKIPGFDKPPIIILAAPAWAAEGEVLLDSCDALLIRPFTKEQLLKEVNTLLPHFNKNKMEKAVLVIEAEPVVDHCDKQKLKGELESVWLKAQKSLTISEIDEMVQLSFSVAEKHQSSELRLWAEELSELLDSFSMLKVEEHLVNLTDVLS
ncbi:MAG: hypothetical protein HRT88_15625 [Lentisphaeraceae bacterium]|nr:hypothetical protein [Lentisphaeraceae bacterium]